MNSTINKIWLTCFSTLMLSLSSDASLFPSDYDLSSITPMGGGDGTDGFVIRGAFFHQVHAIGDVNNDGHDDFILYGASTRQLHIVDGATVSGRAELPLDETHTVDFSFGSGLSIQSISSGDIDNDGYLDFVIGIPSYNTNLVPSGGEDGSVVVVYGTNNGWPSDITSLDQIRSGDGSMGFVMNGTGDERFGSSVSGSGDINGDGYDDVAIGANRWANEGRLYIHFGRDRTAGAVRDVLDGGFSRIDNDFESGLGDSLQLVRDIDLNGFDDLLIAAPAGLVSFPNGSAFESGLVTFLRGTSSFSTEGGFINNVPPPVPGCTQTYGLTMYSTNSANSKHVLDAGFDFNGDGFRDALVGIPKIDVFQLLGSVRVLYGPSFAGQCIENIYVRPGFEIIAKNLSDRTGFEASFVEDMNNDGFDELLIGRTGPGTSVSNNEAYFIYGGDYNNGANLNFSLVDSSDDASLGFRMFSSNPNVTFFSWETASIGDINNDGISDFFVSAYAGNFVDSWNIFVYGRNGIVNDADDDFVLDVSDNCINVDNADQLDADNDGFGNACDTDLNNDCVTNFLDVTLFSKLFLTDDMVADFDGSGVVNFIDYALMTQQFLGEPGPSGLITECDLNPSLMASYTFEEGSLADQTGNGNDGSAVTTLPVNGVAGNENSALQFQGEAGQVISIPHSPTLQPSPGEEFTVNIWFKTTVDASQLSGDPSLIAKTEGGFINGWDIRIDGGVVGGSINNLQFGISDQDDTTSIILSSFPINDGQWHMATMVISSSYHAAYIDGELLEEHALSDWNGITTTDVLEIGNFDERPDRIFVGSLDQVRLYAKALTESEIQTLYDLTH